MHHLFWLLWPYWIIHPWPLQWASVMIQLVFCANLRSLSLSLSLSLLMKITRTKQSQPIPPHSLHPHIGPRKNPIFGNPVGKTTEQHKEDEFNRTELKTRKYPKERIVASNHYGIVLSQFIQSDRFFVPIDNSDIKKALWLKNCFHVSLSRERSIWKQGAHFISPCPLLVL